MDIKMTDDVLSGERNRLDALEPYGSFAERINLGFLMGKHFDVHKQTDDILHGRDEFTLLLILQVLSILADDVKLLRNRLQVLLNFLILRGQR